MNDQDERFERIELDPTAEKDLLKTRERRRPRRPPHFAIMAGLLLALGLFAIGRTLCGWLFSPRDADWKAAADAVRKAFVPGDLIVSAPAWADPMVRLYMGNLMPLQAVARVDDDAFGTLWEVSIRSAQAPETASLSTCTEVLSGRVSVRRCTKPKTPVLFDSFTQLPSVDGAVMRDGKLVTCKPARDRHECGTISLRPIIGEIEYAPRRCIVVSPSVPSEPLRLIWHRVPAGRLIVAHVGIHSFYARKAANGPVKVNLIVDGRQRAELMHANTDGWRRIEIQPPIPQPKSAGTIDLGLELMAPIPSDRKLCFSLQTRGQAMGQETTTRPRPQ